VPQLKLVDGRIVVAQESLVQTLSSAAPGEGMAEVEEREAGFGPFITSATYAKRNDGRRWAP
jgi:hypothetical protein